VPPVHQLFASLKGKRAYPSNPLHLVRNHILLLWSNDHPRSDNPHERNDLLSREAILVDQVS
jgi:hypothetical protein